MQKVIFIELSVDRKDQFITDITESLHQTGKKIHIYASSQSALKKIDQLLWVRKPDSFLPHIIISKIDSDSTKPIEPILLIDQPVDVVGDVLILNDPMELSQIGAYPMIIDFAETYDAQRLQASRQRYKIFRDSGRFELSFEKFGSFLKLIKSL